ncbi:BREX system P-loop protein BrxC, partial [Salinimicrobium sp. CDJ15-91]|nr:BREX system P-loop protein BrxC [Salinimicrobium oceani]
KQKDVLQRFSSKTTESNYIDKAEDFLASNDEYSAAIKAVVKAERFIKKNLDKIKGFERFIQLVKIELQKAAISSPEIESATKEFEIAMGKDIIEHFPEIDTAAQKVRDGYYHLMVDGAHKMSELHQYLKNDIEEAAKDLKQNYPAELNEKTRRDLESLLKYTESRIVKNIQLQYHIQDQNSHLSLTEILNNIQLIFNKESELELIKGNFVKTAPLPPDPAQPTIAKRINLTIP